MYIGIDLGTTACKAARFDEGGRVLARFHKEYGLITRDGFVEQDATVWWQLVLEGLKAVGAPTVRGISISTQGVALGREYIFAVTGKTCGGSYSLPKLMWQPRQESF